MLGLVTLLGDIVKKVAADEHRGMALFELRSQARSFDLEDGLGNQRVKVVRSAPDGTLWVGTHRGFARFNGHRFDSYADSEEALAGEMLIDDLAVDSDGDIWALARDGRLVEQTVTGQRLHFAGDRALQGVSLKLALSADDVPHVITSSKDRLSVFRIENSQATLIAQENATLYPRSLDFTSDGRLWCTIRYGALFEIREGSIEPVPLDPPCEAAAAPFRGRDGALSMVGTSGHYVYQADEWQMVRRFKNALPTELVLLTAQEDANGTLWIGTARGGLWACTEDGRIGRVDVPLDPSANEYSSLAVDRQGNIWSAGIAGLIQFYTTPFTPWSAPESFRRALLFSVAEDGHHRMWFCSDNEIFWQDSSGHARKLSRDGTSVKNRVLTGAREGGAWVGQYDPAIWRVNENGLQFRIALPSGTPNSMVELPSGELLVATSKGLYSVVNRTVRKVDPHEPGSGDQARQIVPGPGGVVYLAYQQMGLSRRQPDGRWEVLLSRLRGKPPLERLSVGPDGTVWARVRPNLLGRWQAGNWEVLPPERLGVSEFHTLQADGEGGLWLNTERDGILRFSIDGLNDCFADASLPPSPSQRFGVADGLVARTGSGRNSGMLVSSQGLVWFASDRGAAALDLDRWPPPPSHAQACPVIIEKVTIDDQRLSIERGETITLAPGANRLNLHFVLSDLTQPERVQYQFRLLGFDEEWSTPSPYRTAAFARLPPGRYGFEVQATDSHGLPTSELARLGVVVAPRWWQRRAVQGGVVLLGVLLLGMFFRGILAGYRRRQAQQTAFSRQILNSQEQERKRIAGELHDSLGQHLLLIKNSTELASRRLETGSPVQERLTEVTALARDALREVRDITQNLRPTELDRLGLRVAVQSMIERITEHANLKANHNLVGLEAHWSEADQISIYRLVQESLNNAIKHAGARTLRIDALAEGSVLQLQIQDDGQGFDPSNAPDGRGLTAMRERVSLMGGRFQIVSREGAGTTIRIELPLAPAAVTP